MPTTSACRHASNSEVLIELARLIEAGHLDVPIAETYRLDQVHAAYRDLEERHTRGKIVLLPS